MNLIQKSERSIKTTPTSPLSGMVLALLLAPLATFSAKPMPNVILIVADDLGYGELSAYGQSGFTTPHIDRLATEGILFTQHYSGNTVCSPSRASLMTGQHPGHVYLRGNLRDENLAALDPEMTVLPEIFKAAGYATGGFGKWGLGLTTADGAPNPLTHGFDTFVGWKSQMIAHTYYPTSIVKNGEEVPLEEGTYIHDLIMQEAMRFIGKKAASGTPFFCFIPTAIPHAAMHAPAELHEKWCQRLPQFDDVIGNYGTGPGESTPDVINPMAGFAAMMEHLDNDVGRLLQLLEELEIDQNTLVLFTSDNGPHQEGGHDPAFWNSSGPLRGIKRDLYEGGIRVPLLARWPGKIDPGRTSPHISAFWDFVPTMADLLAQPIPSQARGISFLPELLEQTQDQHDYLYWEFTLGAEQRLLSRALRMGQWKAVQGGWHLRNQEESTVQESPIELYNLNADLSENKDLSGSHPLVVELMRHLMETASKPNR